MSNSPDFNRPPADRNWVSTTANAYNPTPPKNGSKILVPVGVGIAALLVGAGLGVGVTSSEDPAPEVTITATPEPAPTVTETVNTVPQACLDGFAAADTIRGSASTAFYAVADHLEADLELFANLTDAGVEAYLVEMDEFNAIIIEQSSVTEQAVKDLEAARAGCK